MMPTSAQRRMLGYTAGLLLRVPSRTSSSVRTTAQSFATRALANSCDTEGSKRGWRRSKAAWLAAGVLGASVIACQSPTRAAEEDDEDGEDTYEEQVLQRRRDWTPADFEVLKKKYNWVLTRTEGRPSLARQEHLADLVVFSGHSHPQLTREVCDYLNIPMGRSIVKRFADGEVFVKVTQEIRGRDCFIILPTHSNDNVIELLLSISTMRRASAKRITAVIPYFGYARQDQRMPFRREPIAAADVARMLEEVGVDRVVSVDLHSGQIQGFFSPRIPVDHLTPAAVAAAYFVSTIEQFKHAAMKAKELPPPQYPATGLLPRKTTAKPIVTVIAPHEGQVRRARIFRERLVKLMGSGASVDMALVSKFKAEDGKTLRQLIGDVHGRTCIIVDDLLDTGRTLETTVNLLKAEGADKVYAFATHARCSSGGEQRVQDIKDLEYVVVTNTMPLSSDVVSKPKIRRLSVAPLIAEAILSIHDFTSVSSVLTPDQIADKSTSQA